MESSEFSSPLKTSTNTLSDVTLKDYDNVVATTQIAINQTMGEYLSQHPTDFAIYGIADQNGNVTGTTTDPSKANCYLKGTLQLEKNTDGNYINLVDLYNPGKGNQTVLYNVTMQNGDFHFDAGGLTYNKKQDGTAPWVFKLFVNLSMQDVAKSSLPADLIKKLQNVDENIFSIQQLYLDLNTAALDSIEGVTFPALVDTPAQQLLTFYLKQQQKTNEAMFGVSVKTKSASVTAPTLAPTYVDFCVTPYVDASGNKSNPNLDTLNYLVMTNNNTPPSYTPKSFNFNWVTDEQIHGAMAIKRQPFVNFLLDELKPLLKSLCPVMYCKADGDKSAPNDVVIKLNTGTDHNFNQTYNAGTGEILSYSYNTHNSNTDTGPWYAYYHFTVSGKYSMNIKVNLVDDTIKLSGAITASASTSTQFAQSSSSSSTEMPDTTYNWSVDLQLYMDMGTNAQLDLKIINPNFDSNPVVAKHNESWWEKFLNALSGYMKSYTSDLGDLRTSIKSDIEGNLQSNLADIVKTANHFVFPGAKTFTFKNPQFSDSQTLVSNITYLNPNA
jgi:hypothetical protein